MGRIHSYKSYTVLPSSVGGAYLNVTVTGAVTTLGTIPAWPNDGSQKAGTTANACTITVVGNASTTAGTPCIYYTVNGSTPSATNGLALYNGAVLELFESELANAKFIRADGNNQTLKVEFAIVA